MVRGNYYKSMRESRGPQSIRDTQSRALPLCGSSAPSFTALKDAITEQSGRPAGEFSHLLSELGVGVRWSGGLTRSLPFTHTHTHTQAKRCSFQSPAAQQSNPRRTQPISCSGIEGCPIYVRVCARASPAVDKVSRALSVSVTV